MQEYPVLLQKYLGSRVDKTWFSVIGRVEDLSSHLVGRSKNDEAESQHPSQDHRYSSETHMLKTETADRAPEYHCRL